MENLTFKILRITKEKSINGRIKIEVECQEDNIVVCIVVSHADSANKFLIKKLLIEEHDELVELHNRIEVGDII